MHILTTKHVLIAGAVAAIIVVAALFLAQARFGSYSRDSAPPYVEGKVVLGTLKSIEGNVLTLNENIPEVVTAQFALTASTSAAKQTLLSEAERQANYEKYKQESAATTTLLPPPATGSVGAIALSSLKAGDYVSLNLSTTTSNGMLTVVRVFVLPVAAQNVAIPKVNKP